MTFLKMLNRFSAILGIFVLILQSAPLAGWGAEGETSAPALRLEDLLQTAQDRSPEILAAKAEWLAAKKRIWIDSSLPDPMAEIAPGNSENDFSLSQEIPFPGKLYVKGKMAQKEAQAAYFRYQVIQRDLLLRLTEAYYDLYYVDASMEVIQEVKELLKKIESVASARYSNLSGTQRDVAKAQAEVSMSLEKLYDLERSRERIVAIINALLNADPLAPVGKAVLPEKPSLELSLVELINIAIQKRQEIKAAEAIVAKSSYARKLAGLAYIPDIDIGVKYEQMKDSEAEDVWMLPIRFNIPIWQNRIIPEIQEAKRMAEASRAQLLQAKNTAYFDVKESYYRFKAAAKTAELYETAVIPQAQIALAADRAGYESGKSDFLNLLDSGRVYFNAKLAKIQFDTEVLKAYAELLRCCGLDFNELPKVRATGLNKEEGGAS